MDKIILENLKRDICFTRIYGLYQRWSDFKKWSCIGAPRNQHGLLYIFCDYANIIDGDGNEILHFSKGDLVYIPKHSEYSIEFFNTEGVARSILINFDICDSRGREYYIDKSIVCIAKNLPPKITDSMFTVAHLSTNLAYPTVPVSKAFYDMLDKLINHMLATRLHAAEKDSVLPAIFYLESHVLDEVSVPQLAQMCLLNESAFRKAFKEHTGMNPVQYKMQVKINKAKLLLRNSGELPIETIAETLGFYDNAYFHKVFVKCTGQTPKQYRDSHK